jgi:serine/threonine-protein kinase
MSAPLIAGRYELGPAIGGGAMGTVFLGWDVRSRERVAVKATRTDVLADRPELLGGFFRERQALRRLRHPNIIRLLATCESGGERYLIVEYAAGGSLAGLLGSRPQLPIDRVLAIGLGIAAALDAVHAMGILHRDVKPSNILFCADGAPRLSDFGLARLPGGRAADDMGLVGTFPYISPEAWRSGKLDGRADVWSLGVVLFETLAGRRPFDGDSPYEILWEIENDRLPDVRDYRSDTPDELADLVRRMLMRDPLARASGARLVCAELQRLQKGAFGFDRRPASEPPTSASPTSASPTSPSSNVLASEPPAFGLHRHAQAALPIWFGF